MTPEKKTPAELRSMFGSNLRQLASQYSSISELSRQLGINRTQFNRYLAGESFPRPDVLARICDFFDVDARMLLEPVDSLHASRSEFHSPDLAPFLGQTTKVDEAAFPNGFYRFSRRSFMAPDQYIVGLVYIWRTQSRQCYLRGYEAREAMRQQGLKPTSAMREFRGLVMRLEAGVGLMVSRKGATSASFNFLHPVVSFENNYWTGYLARTVPESLETERVGRLVYEHLGHNRALALRTARKTGIVSAAEVPEYHLRLLKEQTPFR
jgi:transcriptional regulator with XRE-family HTH domain